MAKNDEKGEIMLYQPEGSIQLPVRILNDTVWLTIEQMALLFGKSRSTVNEHILNAISEGEISKDESMRKIGNSDFSTKPTNFYNLDVIISVGYRVKSLQGTLFRRWASKVLKDYMLKGYAVNQRKIATDLQIADRLHEQRQLIENQEEHGREVENYCFYTLFILYFVVVSTARRIWQCQFYKFA